MAYWYERKRRPTETLAQALVAPFVKAFRYVHIHPPVSEDEIADALNFATETARYSKRQRETDQAVELQRLIEECAPLPGSIDQPSNVISDMAHAPLSKAFALNPIRDNVSVLPVVKGDNELDSIYKDFAQLTEELQLKTKSEITSLKKLLQTSFEESAGLRKTIETLELNIQTLNNSLAQSEHRTTVSEEKSATITLDLQRTRSELSELKALKSQGATWGFVGAFFLMLVVGTMMWWFIKHS